MKLITTYGRNSNNKVAMFRYKYIHIFTSWMYCSSISIEAFNSWVQKGKMKKIGKPNEDK